MRTTIKPFLTVQTAKNVLFWYTIHYWSLAFYRHLRATGLRTTIYEAYLTAVKRAFALLLVVVPSARQKVSSELDAATLDICSSVAPSFESCPPVLSLPQTGLSSEELSKQLEVLADLPKTKWENGRVSGAVYHGGEEMEAVWKEAFGKFGVANPLHADVFPGVRKMDSEVVSMCLSLFNSPLPKSILDAEGGAGTTTSGGTESILMACKAYRDRARAERGITKPEMIIPISAHAAFDKAGSYFGIKVHHIPVDPISRKVRIDLVRRADEELLQINPNTILLVGSAPNFPDGIIDDIPSLSALALAQSPPLGLHVDCCLGSFLVPFLEKAGFETEPFDFRVKGVTSISCDTHKYGFAPKGSSVIMYRSKQLRKYQYSVITTWPGGVYASPSMAGSRPGAIIAGAWASMVHLGQDGYLASCRDIVGARIAIEEGIRKDFPELYVLGKPKVSVIAFGSKTEGGGKESKGVGIYEVGDRMNKLGWHLNALQTPPALHNACTRLTVPVVDQFLKDLRTAVDAAKKGREEGEKEGTMVTIYGLGSSSPIGPGLVEEMSSRYMDVVSRSL
ncbi:sphinganine-1-phosphate aldolase [Pseudohyphozyma bogoriensis]|nr:sphinganine-1-phosphate aldolase [Pseudohyphozyma bogoriensis]